jgi:hypothetical protein
MGFLDWIGREHGRPVTGAEPKVTWMSDVYAYRLPESPGMLKETWAWAWVHQTPSGKFNAGMTVRDQQFHFTKWKTGEGFSKEAEAISFAQRTFRAWRKRGPEKRLAGLEIQSHVKNWYQAAERVTPKRYEPRGRPIDF